jgi:YfiH family protein
VQWREQDGARWIEAQVDGATAAFSTRLGGVSEGPFASLNLGLLTDDRPGAVRTNRHRMAQAVGLEPERFLIGRQVHGASVQVRDSAPKPNPFADPGPELDEVDAQATTRPGLVPLVFVADCLPVALRGTAGVAMVHCGWRGLAAGVLATGVQAVGATAAAVGPGIGRCCYEVGEEVLDAFEPLGDGVASGRMLDLVEVARRLLDAAGVRNVQTADLCTSCNPELFFSHRRDRGRTGRQAGLVWEAADG